jgi:hypothetical protein
VSRIYGEEVAQHRLRTMERLLLQPLGLSMQKFLSRQHALSTRWVADVNDQIRNYEPDIQTIIAGADSTGKHIFMVGGNGYVACCDSVGFVAIGIGQKHAESQFMFQKHAPHEGFAETLLLTYIAKKRAEAAPGVGRITDMFIIAQPGVLFNQLSQEELAMLDKFYETMRASQEGAVDVAKQEIRDYLQRLWQPQTPIPQAVSPAIAESTESSNATSSVKSHT